MLSCFGEVCCNKQDNLTLGRRTTTKPLELYVRDGMLDFKLVASAERGRAVLECWTSDFAANLVAMTLWPETRSPTEGSAIERLW